MSRGKCGRGNFPLALSADIGRVDTAQADADFLPQQGMDARNCEGAGVPVATIYDKSLI